MEKLSKENIKSLITSIFELESSHVEFIKGNKYKFEVRFRVGADRLEIEDGFIGLIKGGQYSWRAGA